MLQPLDYVHYALAFIFVISLIGLLAMAAKHYQGKKIPFLPNKRIKVLEWQLIDSRRKMVLVRHDQTEHLFFIGADGEFLVSSQSAKNPASEETP